MSSNSAATDRERDPATTAVSRSLPVAAKSILEPLASLKLTVTLFALSIALVFFGTLAQHRKDIWEVVHTYFRCGVAYVEFQDLLPPSFFPSLPQVAGGFYFPGGWLIGGVMAANLFAAHAIRFKVQAKGERLWAGLGILAVGSWLTYAVVQSGMGDTFQADPMLSWETLWNVFRIAGVATTAATLFWLARELTRSPRDPAKIRLAVFASVPLVALSGWLIFTPAIAPESMRILWQLMKGTLAGLVLLVGCLLAFKKRAGIVLLHAGVVLLMLSELLVGLYAEEGQMQLFEGETRAYVEDIRSAELAIVDSSDPAADRVVAVPASRLTAGGRVTHPELPFEIAVEKFVPNAILRRPLGGEANPATTGAGKQLLAAPARTATGVDVEGGVDEPAAYVSFFESGSEKPFATHLVAVRLAGLPAFGNETVTAPDGTTRAVSLRFTRTYKPYAVTLLDVSRTNYVGTETPRDYSSEVRIVDESAGTDREVRIWMNNPLRYAGDTFYQSRYGQSPASGREYTGLQVVSNEGWMLPYVSCMVVAVGMVAQFVVTLLRFLGRETRPTPAPLDAAANALDPTLATTETGPSTARGSLAGWVVPAVITLVLAAYVGSKFRPPTVASDAASSAFDYAALGRTPVAFDGRVKPLDTVARNALKQIAGNRETFKTVDPVTGDQETRQAIEWLAAVIASPRDAAEMPVYRIENLELLQLLGLERRKGFRYGLAEFIDRVLPARPTAENPVPEPTPFRAAVNDATDVRKAAPERLTPFQRKLLEFTQKLGVTERLVAGFGPDTQRIRRHFSQGGTGIAGYESDYAASKGRNAPPLPVPYDGDWETLGYAQNRELFAQIQAERDDADEAEPFVPSPAVAAWGEVLEAFAADDPARFNAAVAALNDEIAAAAPPETDLAKVPFEAAFNHASPFFTSWILYLFAFVLTTLGWLTAPLGWDKTFRRSATAVIVLTFIVHTLALAARIYISGRPPVTNLYSSAVFIGWGTVAFGLLMERFFGLGFGNAVAALGGGATLLIAHSLSGDGDTFTVLQAVLDTQFWLATHVVCITLGYTATYVGGLVGLFYIGAGAFTPALSPTLGKKLTNMNYGAQCFAIFFSFVGTVLGGLWADDSWGRFWGWDPKENGALMIVLWNALVLHANWGRMITPRGLAALAVAGNIVVSWSWFGVNELGVGLHSYGFTEGVLQALALFAASQLIAISLTFLPVATWWSGRKYGKA